MGKYVHKYMTCGDCGGTTQKGYVEILEFTHFVEFFSFNKISEKHREKERVRKVTVVVALDLGCGNTKNSEYESKQRAIRYIDRTWGCRTNVRREYPKVCVNLQTDVR